MFFDWLFKIQFQFRMSTIESEFLRFELFLEFNFKFLRIKKYIYFSQIFHNNNNNNNIIIIK